MNITIQTIDFKESEKLNLFVREKVGKLFHQSPETIRADVSLKLGSKKTPANKWCSLYISHPGENQFVKKGSTSFEESVLLCVEAMAKTLARNKTKKTNSRSDISKLLKKIETRDLEE
jgi:hypothetical protein